MPTSINATLRSGIGLATRARRLSAVLNDHLDGISDPVRRGALHRLAAILGDFSRSIDTAVAAAPNVAAKLK
jgi:hypothetical protein